MVMQKQENQGHYSTKLGGDNGDMTAGSSGGFGSIDGTSGSRGSLTDVIGGDGNGHLSGIPDDVPEGFVINEPNGDNSDIKTPAGANDPNTTITTYDPASGQIVTTTKDKTTTTTIDPKDLSDAINKIWEMLLGTNLFAGDNLSDVGQQIGSFLSDLEKYFDEVSNLDENTRWQYASQIYNMVSSYMMYQLQNYYSRQNWLFEQSYNSPVNQIGRLIEAGINPAFYYSAASKDTAGEIGGTDAQPQQMAGVNGQTELENALGKAQGVLSLGGSLASTATNIGNLFNLCSQAKLANITGEDIQNTFTGRNAQTFANAGYLTALTDKEKVTLPYLKEQMQSASNLNNAMIENYAITASQRWAEIENTMRICDKQIESSQFIAKLRANADKEIADMTSGRALQGVQFSSTMAYNGTKYQADRNYEATKYATDEQIANSRWCKGMDRRMALEGKAMDNMYDELFFTNYIDETTGQRSHDFAGLGFKPSEYANVSFGTDGTATINGHKIRRDEYKTHVFRYDRMERANQTILNLVRYNDENYVPSSSMFHYAKEYDNISNAAFFKWTLPKVAAAYGSYCSDAFMNTGAVTDAPNGNYQGFVNQQGAGGLTTGWHK